MGVVEFSSELFESRITGCHIRFKFGNVLTCPVQIAALVVHQLFGETDRSTFRTFIFAASFASDDDERSCYDGGSGGGKP